ncbi:hypothetical protein HYT45_01340 [Candidatus Uhrbacteria bacterium]|nr:hypothetical protein [Candidatus Uhrbacteria bacterium]
MKYAGIALSILFASCTAGTPADMDHLHSWDEQYQGETRLRSSPSPAGFESSRYQETICAIEGLRKDYAQDCGDGGCWSTEVDCDEPVFECGGNLHRCLSVEDMANCCNNMFFACPPSHPYYCPQADRRGCHKNMADCREFYLCDYRGWSCSHE